MANLGFENSWKELGGIFKRTNVGDKFAEEVRNIQDGKSEEQNIYGTCTAEEQRELNEDGISILPLPELPPEH